MTTAFARAPGTLPWEGELPKSRYALPALFCLAFLAVSVWVGSQGAGIRGNPWFLAAYAVLFTTMLVVWRTWDGRRYTSVLVTVAVLARLAFIPFPASDDVQRYIWEGRIQSAGHNPFVLAPDAPRLEPLRDDAWRDINHKSIPTIYWPFAQILFRAVSAASPTVIAYKLVFVLFDIAALLVLLSLLTRRGLARTHAVLYALNPLLLVYTAGEGHLEIVCVFWIVLALYALAAGRNAWAFLWMGFAVMTKMPPLVLVPFMVTRGTVRGLWALLLPGLLALPYLGGGLPLMSVPMHFAGHFRFNGLVNETLAPFLGDQGALWSGAALASAALLFTFFFEPAPARAMAMALGAVLLCSPTFHPWYLQLMTPFVVLFRSPPWLVLHLTTTAMVFFFAADAVHPWWHHRPSLLAVEYMPAVAAAVWAWGRSRTRGWPAQSRAPHTVAVVIPALDEERTIGECIASVLDQTVKADILVVDGGSSDRTREVAATEPRVKVVRAGRGRGIQVMAGVESATADVVVVLHADSRLRPGTLARIMEALKNNPSASGGACGATYRNPNQRFRCIEWLNNMRSRVSGISFGDQGQFFRRELLVGVLRPLRIMEDIETSFLLKERGSVLFLPGGVESSTRRWETSGYSRNFLTVVRLATAFVIRRRFGMHSPDCAEFYRAYYGHD